MGIHMYGLLASEVGKGIRDAGYCKVTATSKYSKSFAYKSMKTINMLTMKKH